MSTSSCSNSMTANDKEVINQIFGGGFMNDDVDDDNNHKNNETEVVVEETEVDRQAKRFELEAVQAADRGDFIASLDLCSQAIALAPTRASAYNNRAQVLRLNGDIDGALSDLDKAIELSGERGTTACQAFTQRGLIKIRNDNQEEAKADLQQAADLGSEFAKQLVTAMNPYAALCNQMLGEVMQKLARGEA